ncbi:hypothetical protein [Roseibacillus persicicus]|uniref:hypothetical protein n=1 Tax=Roseibacillus persicicus TaxID=454148 RepID=UPI00280FDAF4|nr:hypothetical protein [Roseibacillus persicicus]MDQ8190591.1 hypothetical protein [Roseibacillus persicicus]
MTNIFTQAKRIGAFAVFEILNKVLGFVVGIFLVRTLPTQDYAWYTIGNTMIGGLASLTAVGVGVGIMSEGGPRFGNLREMGEVVASARKARILYFLIFAPVVVIFLSSLLWTSECPPGMIFLFVSILLLFFVIQLNVDIASNILKLASRQNLIQMNGVTGTLSRSLLLAVLWSVAYLNSVTALLSAAAAAVMAYLVILRPEERKYYKKTEQSDSNLTRKFRIIGYNLMPETLSAFVMPQITLFIIAIFADVESVASLGAIGRITLLLSIPTAVITSIFIPQMARAQTRKSLWVNWSLAVALSFFVAVILMLVTKLYPSSILYLLGENYANLENEVFLSVSITSVAFAFSSVRSILMAKGWVSYLWVQPIINVISLIVSVPFFELSSLEGVLTMNLVRQGPPAIFSVIIVFLALRRRKLEI